MPFDVLGLSDEVLRAVNDSGYTEPTPIQRDAIPVVLMGRDVLGCAQTGTGKTASFTLPMIDILASGQAKARMPRSLILEPTRELAAQVAENFTKYTKYQKLNFALLIGGERFGEQEKALDRGCDVLIATPGRLIDLFERGKILLSDVKVFVIDEADRMLDMGFIPDVERIASLMPKLRQTLFFSATMPPEIRKLANQFLMNPKEITVAPPASPAATVAQHKVVVPERDKKTALRSLIQQEDVTNAIIFCNRKRDVDMLLSSLKRHGLDAAGLHGDMAQPVRTATLEKFRDGEVRLLIASDVAARGLDIPLVGHVFNFDVPLNADDYIHRIGRTGRAGRSGRAFMLVSPDDTKLLAAVESMLGKEIPQMNLEGFQEPELEEAEGRRRSSTKGKRKKEAEEERPSRARRPAAEAKKPEKEERARTPRRRKEREEETPLGFGDEIPAFMQA
ncbi:MAG TPA: DEAD/DEAH box helicase [Alphaproteobacteria bacterium]|nr:DEAD/DEAH box helicase [Alphaproteobacteria bacterium]